MAWRLNSDSEMSRAIESVDWSATPFGAMDTWSETLMICMRTMLDAAFPIAIYWGEDLRILYNDAFRIYMGPKHPACIGQPAAEVWSEIWTALGPQMKEVWNSKKGIRFPDQVHHIHRDRQSEECHFDYSFSPLLSGDGQEVVGIYTTGVENTARVMSERANRRLIRELADERQKLTETSSILNLAMDAAKIGTWDLDLTTGIVNNSARTAEIFGLPGEGFHPVGDSLRRIHPEDRARVESVIAAAAHPSSDGHYELDYRIIRNDGSTCWVRVVGQAMFEHSACGVIGTRFSGTLVDITEAVLAKRDLLQAKESAERANASKSDFLANMSHEIRTPLGAVLGFTELLKDVETTPLERDRYIDRILRAGKALTAIIDDILDLAKIESGLYEVEKIDFSLVDLVSDAVNLFEERAKKKGITLLVDLAGDCPDRTHSDPTRIRQILLNLVGNAVKFTESGSVRVTVRGSGDHCSIDVKDTGIGLSPEQQKKLFEPFVQADNSMSRKFGGTGLGLALSQRLAHALGGEIHLGTCELGGGCTFTFTFPSGVEARS